MATELNQQQLNLALAVHSGVNPTAAYRQEHPECTSASAWVCASRTLRLAKVKALRKALLESDCEDSLLSLREKRRNLAQFIEAPMTAILDPETGEINEDLAHWVHEIVVTKRTVRELGEPVEIEVTRVKVMSKKEAYELQSRLAGHFAAEQEKPTAGEGLDFLAMMRVPSFCKVLVENPEIRAILLEQFEGTGRRLAPATARNPPLLAFGQTGLGGIPGRGNENPA